VVWAGVLIRTLAPALEERAAAGAPGCVVAVCNDAWALCAMVRGRCVLWCVGAVCCGAWALCAVVRGVSDA